MAQVEETIAVEAYSDDCLSVVIVGHDEYVHTTLAGRASCQAPTTSPGSLFTSIITNHQIQIVEQYFVSIISEWA